MVYTHTVSSVRGMVRLYETLRKKGSLLFMYLDQIRFSTFTIRLLCFLLVLCCLLQSPLICQEYRLSLSSINPFNVFQFSFKFLLLRLLSHVKVSVRCLFKGRPIQSFGVVITFSTFVVFIFKGN